MSYPHLRALFYNQPLMMLPAYMDVYDQYLQARAMGEAPQLDSDLSFNGVSIESSLYMKASSESKPYFVTSGGVALLPVRGTLVHRGAAIKGSSGGLQGYTGTADRLQQALADPDVNGIMLDTDSPGGSVAGLYQFTDRLRASEKPVWSHSNESMYSAAYAIGSATDRIIASRTAGVGSIGVRAMHVDQSAFDKRMGIKVTPIYAGARKVDGNPHEPLSDEAFGRIQAVVDKMYTQFVDHVASGRPMSHQQIRNTEADTYQADDGRSLGLVDDIMNFEDAVREMEAYVSKGARVVVSQSLVSASTNHKGDSMSDKQTPADTTSAITQAQLDAAVATATAEGHAEGVAAGATAERERIGAILNHEAAEGRADTARTLALYTDLDAEAAARVLASTPVAATLEQTTGSSEFSKMMSGFNPDLGQETGDSGEPVSDYAAGAAAAQKYLS